jgi:hypothetical protein
VNQKHHKTVLVGWAENMENYLTVNYKFFSAVKPGANMRILTNSVKNNISNLTFKDTVLLCTGLNDISNGNLTPASNIFTDFVRNNNLST